MDPSSWSWPSVPAVPTPGCPYPRTFNQQPEDPVATQEGDCGHGGLTCVAASGIKSDGAERERGPVPQGYRVLWGREERRGGM